MVAVKNLTVMRGGEAVLDSVSFELSPHKVIGLTGPNGGGKTTLFETLLGFQIPTAGSIVWSRPVELAFLPQQVLPRKILPISVRDFIEMGTWGVARQATAALSVEESLQLLELQQEGSKLISTLSGGQWRRTLLGRCLVQPADFYLLDEPFNQIDLEMENRIGKLLNDLAKRQKKTFFVISHDWHAMDHFFDHLLFLNRKILAEGSVREVSEVSMNFKSAQYHKWMHPK